MRALIGCERYGIIREAINAIHGWTAYSCDLAPCEDGREDYHIQADILDVMSHDKWDLFICHPPCTRLCNSGVRWLNERNLWDEMREAAEFFKACLSANIKRKCIENPIPHKYAIEIIGCKYDQIIQPWMFGHGETKATCLWLENLPKLKPTKLVKGREQRTHYMSPSPTRGIERSKTYAGIAIAMADQWTSLEY